MRSTRAITRFLLVLLVVPVLPVEWAADAGHGPPDVLISFTLAMDRNMPCSVEATFDTSLVEIGLSSGRTWEVVFDPTPGTPMVPMVATAIRIEGEITGCSVVRRGTIRSPLASPFDRMPAPASPYEVSIVPQARELEAHPPDGPYLLERIGWEHLGTV